MKRHLKNTTGISHGLRPELSNVPYVAVITSDELEGAVTGSDIREIAIKKGVPRAICYGPFRASQTPAGLRMEWECG